MTKNSMTTMLSRFVCIVLIAAMALCICGCGNTPAETPQTPSDPIVMGEGETVFYFTAEDLEGNVTFYEIHTDKTTVGEALMELGLIAGDPGDYGLYVKNVNGVELDWDTHGKYWAFYADGEYGLTGVDMTDIVPGTTYAFKPES